MGSSSTRKMRGIPKIRLNIVESTLFSVNTSTETNLFLFTKNTMFTKFHLTITLSHKRPLLPKIVIPLSLIWSRRIYHNFVTSQFDMDNYTTVEPVTVDLYNTYKLPDLSAFIKIRTPLETFRTPLSAVYLHSRDSKVPREVRFLFKSRTYNIS